MLSMFYKIRQILLVIFDSTYYNMYIMVLIKCIECKKEISDKAETCQSCGNPIRHVFVNGKVEIEATNKRWKKIHLISWAMIIGGLIFMGNDQSRGVGFWGGANLIILGIMVRYIGKLGAWWSNR